MPMVKSLEIVHQQLMDIAKESNRLSYTKYTADDVNELKGRLREIDSQYSEGTFSTDSCTDTRYEQEGLAQVVNELEKVHKTLHVLLYRIEGRQ
ncbi:hypothetical protein BDB01DRAFT_786814 [Pilobolus umbonatus]|nr:hypothetical protein BDB01DRAFT_786814 [Pilobolus umbonatus]